MVCLGRVSGPLDGTTNTVGTVGADLGVALFQTATEGVVLAIEFIVVWVVWVVGVILGQGSCEEVLVL